MSPAKHTFSYRFIDNTKFVRPYISVSIRTQNSNIPSVLALVDSGADFCMFDGLLAQTLNIDLKLLQQIKLSGINGSAIGYMAHLEIGINDQFVACPTVFSFDFSPSGFGGIIGQVGFFDSFKIQFDRANKELIILYWHIGKAILDRQKDEGWGTKVIERLSKDLHAAFPQMKGFSIRSLKYMRTFALTYQDLSFVQQPAAQL